MFKDNNGRIDVASIILVTTLTMMSAIVVIALACQNIN